MIISAEDTKSFIHQLGPKKTIVLTGGCFDILHPAHTEFLKRAKKLSDILVVLLESDENIRKLKGQSRPKNSLGKRSENLELLGFIDLVIQLPKEIDDKYYANLTNLIQPDIIAITEGDPQLVKKQEQAEKVGAKVVSVMKRDTDHSSSRLMHSR